MFGPLPIYDQNLPVIFLVTAGTYKMSKVDNLNIMTKTAKNHTLFKPHMVHIREYHPRGQLLLPLNYEFPQTGEASGDNHNFIYLLESANEDIYETTTSTATV